MDFGRRELVDRLAAEYVLGTLRGPARRRFESLLPAHPLLRDARARWEAQLEPLAASIPAVEPPPAVWRAIEGRLFGPGHEESAARADAAAAAPAGRWWQRLAPWRALTGVASVAAVAAVVVATRPAPPAAPVVVVLAANPESARVLDASFVASVSADGRALVLRPLNPLTLSPERALELWALPAQGAPRSLGLVQPAGATTLLRARLLVDTTAFAVSVEPAGGSPTGAPTGPIVSLGNL